MNNAIKIENVINEIGKAQIIFDDESQDFLINSVNPNSISQDYFLELYNDFKSLIYLQLRENCSAFFLRMMIKISSNNVDFLNNLIKKRREDFALDKKTNNLSENLIFTNEYIDKILDIKIKTLLLIKNILEDEYKYFGLHTSKDYLNYNERLDNGNDILISEKTEKATFNLGKKESIMLIYVFEQSGLLKFKDEAHRKKFIENNFCYSEVRDNENKGKSFPMNNIASELSVIKASHQKTTNNNTLERLLKHLSNTIHNYEF
jgi:hypothetical protein